MSYVVGVELSPEAVRVVALGRGIRARPRTLEVAWDPERPEELARALRAEVGGARHVGVAVGLGLLHPKQVRLPPLSLADRRRMLALEPDRFFPVSDRPLVVALLGEENLAFAADAARLERWIDALAGLGPVENVEPAPLALARALGPSGQGTYAVPAGPGEWGAVGVAGGRVTSARLPGPGSVPVEVLPLPEGLAVPGPFLAALGAARGVFDRLDGALLPDAARARLRRRRARRVAVAGASCVAALALAVAGVDGRRERLLERVRAEAAATTARAGGALALERRLAVLEREAALVRERSSARPDVLRVLSALSARLPAGATVLNARATGSEWQIDGTALDAAAVVQELSRDSALTDVRFLSSSTRFRDGGRTVETFSIAFRGRAPR